MSTFWAGKRVLVTGHTGFKGSWLSLWLHDLGAEVFGLALAPETSPAMFDQLSLQDLIDHKEGDIRDVNTCLTRISEVQPDVVFHLAAQPLVLESFKSPLETWQTNVMGSLHMMEAVRTLEKPCAVVMITTDKVYENREWTYPYREVDPLGGHDPYSASKAAMELSIASWRKSFLGQTPHIRIASARAGNVIGGGDWAENRIIPDLVRAVSKNRALKVRKPDAVRPWQHVLDPLAGYLRLAERLSVSPDPAYQTSFNFGPEAKDIRTVRALIEEACRHWSGTWTDTSDPNQPHEAQNLSLTIERARSVLEFQPSLDLETSIALTMAWYRSHYECENMREISLNQIRRYPLQ